MSAVDTGCEAAGLLPLPVTDFQKNNSFISALIRSGPDIFAFAACYISGWRVASIQSAETLWKVSKRKYQTNPFLAVTIINKKVYWQHRNPFLQFGRTQPPLDKLRSRRF